MSKSILERVIKSLAEQFKYNKWKNTNSAIEWFENITNKHCTLMQFDIKEFYSSITEEILDTETTFAKSHSNINNVELRTIKHCRKFLLFSNNEVWKKKSTDSCFDVNMCSYRGAVTYCPYKMSNDKLLYVHTLSNHPPRIIRQLPFSINERLCNNSSNQTVFESAKLEYQETLRKSGTYCPYKKSNGKLLYVHTLSNHPPRIIRQLPFSINERLCNNSSNQTVFESAKLEYQETLRKSGTYCPYKKSNDKLLYVHTLSNHPPRIIRQLPLSINERLCNNSSNQTVFELAKLEYQETLRKSGYKSTLKYKPKNTSGKNKKEVEILYVSINHLAKITPQT